MAKTQAELIGEVVRFCKTHSEHYSRTDRDGALADGEFFMTIEPTNPNGIMKNSNDHREEVIAFWTREYIKRFGEG